ncbi:MAG TPA: TetR/AcrR family transcriptional regulator [Stellaceae bacterium]
MVQKSSSGRRGRPRAYDPDAALDQARDAFWDAGYASVSLDDLSAATGMNRPSLYGAFGDKRALYLKALEQYFLRGKELMEEALAPDRPLRDGIRRVYRGALSLYFSGDHGARGCFLIGTATTEAARSPEVRAALGAALRAYDEAFATRLRIARERGEIRSDADPDALARIASAVMHSLAVRSRAGDSRAELEATVETALDLICGPSQTQ